MITEYENLSIIFHFVKVDADQVVYRQHRQVRRIVQAAARRPWPEFSVEAISEWLARHPRPGRLIGVEGSRGADVAAEADALVERLRARGIDAADQPVGRIGPLRRPPARRRHRRRALAAHARAHVRDRPGLQAAMGDPARAGARAGGAGRALRADGRGRGHRCRPPRGVAAGGPALRARGRTTRLAKERKPDDGWQPKADRGFGEYCAAVLGSSPSGFKRRAAREGHGMARRRLTEGAAQGDRGRPGRLTSTRRARPSPAHARLRSGRR